MGVAPRGDSVSAASVERRPDFQTLQFDIQPFAAPARLHPRKARDRFLEPEAVAEERPAEGKRFYSDLILLQRFALDHQLGRSVAITGESKGGPGFGESERGASRVHPRASRAREGRTESEDCP